MDKFTVSSDPKDLDFEMIYDFISQSYWAKGIPRETLQKAIDNSLVFGVYTEAGSQVGFARLSTDKATFAYLADVFILEPYRGRGLSKLLVSNIINHPDLQGLRRMMLATRDAHGLYADFGFKPIENPDMLMQIWNPTVYQ